MVNFNDSVSVASVGYSPVLNVYLVVLTRQTVTKVYSDFYSLSAGGDLKLLYSNSKNGQVEAKVLWGNFFFFGDAFIVIFFLANDHWAVFIFGFEYLLATSDSTGTQWKYHHHYHRHHNHY